MKANHQQNNDISDSSIATKTGLTVLLVLLAAGPWLPPTLMWGINHTAWLHPLVRAALPLAGAVMIWTRAGALFGSWLVNRLAPGLFGRTWILYGVVPGAGAMLFWILRERTHMLGDGQTLAVMLAGDNLYHGFDFMTYHLLALIYQGTGGGGESAAFRITAVAACVSGVAYLAAAGWASRRLADQPGSRLLLYVLLVCGSPLLIFFGYMEVYAPLAVALLVFVTAFILYMENRGALTTVAIAWSCGLFLHLNALFLAPLLVPALIRRPPEGRPGLPGRVATLVWPPAAVLLLAGVILFSGGYDLARMKADFGHVGQGSGILVSLTGPDGLFSWRHLKDTLNLLLLLAPVPLVLLAAHSRLRSDRTVTDPVKFDLLITALWLILVMALVHLKLGAVRDWDLFAPQVCLLTLIGWYAVAGGRGAKTIPPALVGSVTATALVLVLPWLAVTLDSEKSLARLEAAAADMSPYALGLLHEQFAYHHQLAGNTEAVIRHYRRCGEVCPNHPRFHAIYGTHMLNEGHLNEAAAAYDRAVAADSTYVYGLKMGVLARVMNADYAGALDPARLLERLGGQDAEAAAAHGMAAQQMGLLEEAERAYLRGYDLDPNRLDLLERAAGVQLMGRKYVKAEEGFRKVLAARPDHAQAALGLADAIWQDYLAQGQGRTVADNRTRLRETVNLIERVLALKPSDPAQVRSLNSWAGQVHSALAAPAGE